MIYENIKTSDRKSMLDSKKKVLQYIRSHSRRINYRMLHCIFLTKDLMVASYDAFPDQLPDELEASARSILRKAVSLDVDQVILVTEIPISVDENQDHQHDQYMLVDALSVAGVTTLDHIVTHRVSTLGRLAVIARQLKKKALTTTRFLPTAA